MKIEIRNGRVIDPKHGIDRAQSLYMAAGRIVGVGRPPSAWTANRTVDAQGRIVCPGLIDLSARLREPGFEYKATLESEMDAAVAGGVTSLACSPDTDPPLDEPGLVEMLKHRARSLNQAHVYPVGALTVGLEGIELTEMGELAEAGCVAFSQAEAPLIDTGVLLRALQYAGTFGHRVWLRPQEAHLAKGGIAHDGEVATRLGLAAIPASAETIALATIFALVRSTGVRVHLCRLSTAEGVAMVRAAKRDGLPVTCDVAVHHLHLCDVDIGWFDAQCRLIPPLRSTRDRAALRAGLGDGTIDLVCSDHTPVDDDGKQLPFGEAEPGATGLELLLPLTLKWAVEDGISVSDALARITSVPASILGIDAGHLGVGAPADVCIFDPDLHWRVEPAALKSQGKNTPFLGLEVPGKVRATLVGGQLVFEC
jgi:dihydroorotase